MKVVLKRVSIAAGLVVFCVLILAATKAYGIWVITGFAVVLFVLGILRKETPPGKTGEIRDPEESRSQTGENP